MLSLLIFSCSEKTKSVKLASSVIDGPLADYFEVVVRDYQITGDQINFEFVRVKDGFVEPRIVAEFLDKEGNVTHTSSADFKNNNDELRFLLANNVGESSTVAFEIGEVAPVKVRFRGIILNGENPVTTDPSPEPELEEEIQIVTEEPMEALEVPSLIEFKEEIEKVTEILGEVGNDEVEEEEEEEQEEVEEEEEEEPAQSTDSKKWDKILDDYESYVDQYIKLLKKATSGDLSAMTEYVSFLEKAQELQEELDGAKDELTTTQMKRLVKINQKLTDAAVNAL